MAEFELAWTVEEKRAPKGADWFWMLGIFVLAFVVIGFLLGNIMFSLLALLSGAVIVLVVHREPAPITYAISLRGVEVDGSLYPYRSLKAFCVDRTNRDQFFLRFHSEHIFAPLTSIPIHHDVAVDIEKVLAAYVKEEHIDEPLSHRLFAIIGL